MGDIEVYCHYCGSAAEHSNCRLMAKGTMKFKCKKCVRVDLTVSRKAGSVEFIREWPREEMQAFYKNAAVESAHGVTELFQKNFRKFRNVEEYFEVGGAYLPLSVWTTKGWDPERIKVNSKPEDVRYSEQGCEVYRARIMSTGTRGAQGSLLSTRVDKWILGDQPVRGGCWGPAAVVCWLGGGIPLGIPGKGIGRKFHTPSGRL